MYATQKAAASLCLAASVGVFLLFGCATVPEYEMTETMELPETGYTIDYPAGWYVEVMEPLGWAVMSQNEVELMSGMMTVGGSAQAGSTRSSGIGVSNGYAVWFQRIERLTAATLARAGSEPTPRDLFPLVKWLGWEAPADAAIEDVAIADVTAVVAELAPPPSAALFYIATYEGSVYMLRVQAPTVKDLERFKPTWERMLSSIRPVG